MPINNKKFEEKIRSIYPQISDELSIQVTEQLFKFWSDIIDNLDKLVQISQTFFHLFHF